MPILVMPDATYRFSPTGGWHMPTSILTTIKIPKWTGSIPSFMATGNRIGAMISTIDDGSMTLPANNSKTLTTSRKVIGPRPLSVIMAAIACGMFSLVTRNENRTALVMMYNSIADIEAESSNTFGTCLRLMSLYTNTAMMKAYTAAIAAASVGVKTPV